MPPFAASNIATLRRPTDAFVEGLRFGPCIFISFAARCAIAHAGRSFRPQ